MQRHYVIASGIVLALAMAGCSGGGTSLPATNGTSLSNSQFTAVDADLTTSSGSRQKATTSSTSTTARIDIGSTSTVSGWSAETGYISGGWRESTSATIDTGKVFEPAPVSIYQSDRTGASMTVTVGSLTAGAAYTARLHFEEPYWTGAGYRLFNVAINGTTDLKNFDIYATTGGKNIANVQQFGTTANSSGKIAIVFTAVKSGALIAGIEIVPGAPVATPAPTQIHTPQVMPGGWLKTFPKFAGYNPLPAKPVIHPESQAMIDVLWNNTNGHGLTGPGITDAQSTMYDAKSTDPVHTIHCAYRWGPAPNHTCVMEGKQIHIPAGAVPGANVDAHMSILQPDGCTLEDFWQMQQNTSAATLTASFGAEYNQCTEDGFSSTGGGATQGGGSNRIGRTTLAELQTGVIHHAVELAASCNPIASSIGQSTADGVGNPCVNGDTGPSIPYGAYLWSDVTPAQLPASLDKVTRMLCVALNAYGGVVDDTIGPWNGLSINGLWNTPGNPAYAQWLAANAPNGQPQPSQCFPKGDWHTHIHVLAF